MEISSIKNNKVAFDRDSGESIWGRMSREEPMDKVVMKRAERREGRKEPHKSIWKENFTADETAIARSEM